jgi:hypothetical protein
LKLTVEAMENSITTNKGLNSDNIYETIFKIESKYGNPDLRESNSGLTVEDARNFFHYLKKFDLANDRDLLILPPNNHYYFDEKELRDVRTLINLKNLNLIKELDTFLYTLIRLLPHDANFLGYFSYSKITLSGDNLFSGLTTRLTNFLDFKTDHNLDEKEFTRRMYKYGFRLLDLTEMNGLTYFYSKKFKHSSHGIA